MLKKDSSFTSFGQDMKTSAATFLHEDPQAQMGLGDDKKVGSRSG